MNWRQSLVLRKSRRYCMAIRRYGEWSVGYTQRERERRPPVMVNSFPKSGTHLLLEIVKSIPGLRDWGFFLVTRPSVTYRKNATNDLVRRINVLAADELVPAHLEYEADLAAALRTCGAIHYFIYRDLRDTVISEAHYLVTMNRWHALHKYFRALPDMDKRIEFALRGACEQGVGYDYPDIGVRFDRYAGWLEARDVMTIKYEDLMSNDRERVVTQIISHYRRRAHRDFNLDRCVDEALQRIDAKDAHTYRRGQVGAWEAAMNPEQKRLARSLAGEWLQKLGYE